LRRAVGTVSFPCLAATCLCCSDGRHSSCTLCPPASRVLAVLQCVSGTWQPCACFCVTTKVAKQPQHARAYDAGCAADMWAADYHG
jgi:hypothetical protein